MEPRIIRISNPLNITKSIIQAIRNYTPFAVTGHGYIVEYKQKLFRVEWSVREVTGEMVPGLNRKHIAEYELTEKEE